MKVKPFELRILIDALRCLLGEITEDELSEKIRLHTEGKATWEGALIPLEQKLLDSEIIILTS